jgi:predicted nucleotidyltransferase/DNA-binding XRE family transcriptional regulator
MDSLGNTIRKLRENKDLPLRTVAAFLDIDQAILSKIERGQRNASRTLVLKLAEFFEINENDLLVCWLSDKLVHEIADEDIALKALHLAEEKVQYKAQPKVTNASIIQLIKSALEKDGRVAKAWLFGSFAKDLANSASDIDIMVEMNDSKKYSMFDLLDIAHILENKTNRKIDLVEAGYLKDFAINSAAKDLIKIYG